MNVFKKISYYKLFLSGSFLAAWIWSAIDPLHPADWLLENYLVFIFVPVILATGRYFRLSNISYTCITIFMILHVIGAHYTYSAVPFGYTLQEWLGSDRNMYDRLVHFSFGFLWAYPIREMFLRVARVKGVWGYYLPLDVILSLSGLFEIFEWIAASSAPPEVGRDYLGMQGDIWDAQKDMLLATIGALITLSVTAYINYRYNRSFWRGIKKSLSLRKRDKPLGEVKLRELFKKSK